MNKAVFLDRDGVINRKGGSYYIFRKEEFIFNQDLFEALRYFRSKGFLLIIITNQGGIAKGVFSEQDLTELHNFMSARLREAGIILTDVFYCPHHPDIATCECRKPGTLMFEQAVKKYHIDPHNSYMIGDSDIDIIAAEKLGIKGIMIPVNGNIMELIVNKGKI